METIVVVGVLGSITAWLSYRHQVFDYFVYVMSIISMLFAFVWFAFIGDHKVALMLLAFGVLTSGLFFAFRHIKYL